MKGSLLCLFVVVAALGCARVRVEAPKEPIKVDISMRLDIYQHVQKDIDAIESIVSGDAKQPVPEQSLLDVFLRSAYAQEALSPEVEEAALRRKGRYAELNSLLASGIVGEDSHGLVQVRDHARSSAAVQSMVDEENADRMVIYNAIARKNSTSVDEVQKMYAGRLQKDAPAGSCVETPGQGWKVK